MAVLTGISGMNIGDGSGGKVALSLETRVLRMLADSEFSYMFATLRNPTEVKTGTVSYYVPELLTTTDYGDGTTPFQTPNVGLVSINLDTRRTAKYKYETFDVERLTESDYIMGMVSTGLAMSIQADLNFQFLNYMYNQLKTGGTLQAQKIDLDYICNKTTFTPDQGFDDYLKLEYGIIDISTIFDKNKLGVQKAEIMALLSPYCDVGLRIAFRNQPNSIGNWQIEQTLVGKQIGNLKYKVDNMLDKQIAAKASFNDQEVNLTNFIGMLFHNEAIAMPMNLNTIVQLLDPQDANPQWIAKYQFGIGILRPNLVYGIWRSGKQDNTRRAS